MSAEPKFTPGPWRAKPSPSGHWIIASDVGHGLAYAAGESILREEPSFPVEDNARLIAAAPDLYAALDLARQVILDCGVSPHPEIDAALAKARGE